MPEVPASHMGTSYIPEYSTPRISAENNPGDGAPAPMWDAQKFLAPGFRLTQFCLLWPENQKMEKLSVSYKL